MEISFESEHLGYYERLYTGSYSQEVTAECIVPDSMPDVASVLSVWGTALLRGKEAQTGRLLVSGVCELRVLLQPDEGSRVQMLTTEAPFEAAAEVAGLTEADRLMAEVKVIQAEARLLNSRKLLLRAEICVTAAVWAPRRLHWHTRCADSAEPELQMQLRSVKAMPVTDVTERVFGLEEDFVLPGGRPPLEELLHCACELWQEDRSVVGTKLILRGTAQMRLLYLAKDGSIASAPLQAPFSAILELSGEESGRLCEVLLALTGLHAASTPEGGIHVELGAVAQAAVRSQTAITCITDAYSLRHATTSSYAEVVLDDNAALHESSDTVRIQLDSLLRPQSILSAELICGKPRTENGQYRVPVTAKLLCLTDREEPALLTGRGEAVQPAAAGTECLLAAAGEAFAAVTSTGAELRAPVTFRSTTCEKQKLRILEQTEQTEEQTERRRASVIVLRAAEGDSVWSLGKRTRCACSVLRQLNDMAEDAELTAGQLVILTSGS